MNFLVATSRQYRPEHEWAYAGTRRLIEEAFSQRLNWALYDQNPDLLTPSSRTHRRNLASNSFHHVTLLPFSGVVLSGTAQWMGEEMELLYGALSKRDLPLWGLGLSVKDTTGGLTAAASISLARERNLFVVRDAISREWFKNHGWEAQILPCPSLFAHRSSRSDIPIAPRRNPRLGIMLQDSQRPGSRFNEKEIRKICHLLSRMAQSHEISILCPTMDDFMRFSTMFPDLARYSFDASDYLSLMSECDLVITADTRTAAAAQGALKPALLIGEQARQENLSHLPFTSYCELDALRDRTQEILSGPSRSAEISQWRERIRVEWRKLLGHQSLITHANRTSARTVDVSTN